MYKVGRMPPATASRLIANFMTALIPIEKYLKGGRPLTGLQVESLSLALATVESFLAVWKAAKGYKVLHKKSDRTWFIDGLDKAGHDKGNSQSRMDRNWAAVALGRRGGLKGGNARAKKLSPERRAAIARLAVSARWARRKTS